MRLIDADVIKLPNDLPYKASVKRVLIQAPTVDAVVVIRCGECEHGLMDGWLCGGPDYTMPSHPTYPECFCSYGKRRET